MDMNFILASIGVFLVTILVLVIILLVAKNFLVSSGKVKLTINGENQMEVESGSTLLNTLAVNGVFLPSACGGKGSCGQCKCQVVEGGGEILPSEVSHFSRKQQKDHWRLGCQVKVKGDLSIKVPESVMGVKEYECTVISNKNVATFIKEFKELQSQLLFLKELPLFCVSFICLKRHLCYCLKKNILKLIKIFIKNY